MSGKHLLAAVAVLGALGIAAALTSTSERDRRSTALSSDPAATLTALSDGQRADVRKVVRRYLIENPGVIVEALEILQARQEDSERGRSQQAIVQNRDALLANATDPVIGPASASVTIVEFFDYQCPYCKRVTSGLMALAAGDPDLRVVFKEFPILGDASVLASKAALAAAKQGKYTEFHVALMRQRGQLTSRSLENVAQRVSLDLDRWRTDMQSADIDAIVKANYRLAQAIGITGTPAFIIGDQLIPGAIDPARMAELVANARKGGS